MKLRSVITDVTGCLSGIALSVLLILGCGGTDQQQAAVVRDTPIVTAPVRFLSMNIASGAGAQWLTPAMRAQQAAFIAAQNPDIVGMQEVDVGVARSGGGNTAAAAVGSLAQYGTILTVACAHVDGNGNLSATGNGQVGVGAWVSSAFRVVDYWIVELDFTDKSAGGDGWPRCSMLVSVQTPLGHPFVFAVSHLETGDRYQQHVTDDRKLEVEETVSDGPDVFLGDMNALGQEIKADLPPQYRLCDPQPDAPPDYVSAQYGCLDQVWSMQPCTGDLIPTHEAVTDHPYTALGVVNL